MIKIIEFAQRFGAPPPDFIFNAREFFWSFYHKRIWSFVYNSRKMSTQTVKYCMGGGEGVFAAGSRTEMTRFQGGKKTKYSRSE